MILVTGMHRSGTSLVAMTMEALGISFGDHGAFYEADRWNARGYFERRDVMDINNRMITGFRRTGSRMAALAGQLRYLSEPDINSVLGRGRRFAEEISRIGEDIGSGAIKDPRFCITWSAWSAHLDITSCVVCIRHPYEVADSLRRRQRIPIPLGLRFWRYHLRALQNKIPPRLVVVDLDSLTGHPEAELAHLIRGLGLEVDIEQAIEGFRDLYEPEMRKRTVTSERPELDPETAELWDWIAGLRDLSITGRSE